jgi:enoyl-[acyl-carrier-protein] reductase (NADH)
MNEIENNDLNQDVMSKYLDLESGLELELEDKKLYNLKKNKRHLKIVKAVKNKESEFDKLDHYCAFEENSFLTDQYLDEILRETYYD